MRRLVGALYYVMLLLVDSGDLGALKLTRDGDGMPLKRRVMRPPLPSPSPSPSPSGHYRVQDGKALSCPDFDLQTQK